MIVNSFLKLIHDPAISALLGAILGAVFTLIVGYMIEYWKDVKFKKKIRNFVNTELEFYQDFLNKLLVRGRERNGNMEFDDGTENIRWINQMMPLSTKKLKSESYMQLTAETKSSVFSVKTIIALNDVYRLLDYFQYRDVEFSGIIQRLFTKAEIDKILEEIQKAKSLLKHSFHICNCLKSACTTKNNSERLETKNIWSKDNMARYLLIIGFVLTGVSTAVLFYTSHWTSICIVDALEQQIIDKSELHRCINTPADVDGIFLIVSTIGFVSLTFSSAIALRKKR